MGEQDIERQNDQSVWTYDNGENGTFNEKHVGWVVYKYFKF